MEYVVGFLFGASRQNVALIRKKKPEWQAGKLNGIGGKLEPGEEPHKAMAREFYEEAGYYTEGWRKFCELRSGDAVIHCFSATLYDSVCQHVATCTEERVVVKTLHEVMLAGLNYDDSSMLPNVPWLVMMALRIHGDSANSFVVQEVY